QITEVALDLLDAMEPSLASTWTLASVLALAGPLVGAWRDFKPGSPRNALGYQILALQICDRTLYGSVVKLNCQALGQTRSGASLSDAADQLVTNTTPPAGLRSVTPLSPGAEVLKMNELGSQHAPDENVPWRSAGGELPHYHG
ncbi:hypothetical protein HPB47_024751, partial [Ixodes persulcatus]